MQDELPKLAVLADLDASIAGGTLDGFRLFRRE